MFFSLLLVTFIISIVVSFGVVKLFNAPISAIFKRIIHDEISNAWVRYVKFAAFVVGVAGGVRIQTLERYITAPRKEAELLVLNTERWSLEIARTIIETLQAIAWMYLVVFLFTLIAYVVVRGFERKTGE